MPLTPEQLQAELEDRLRQPKEAEYRSDAGTRRRENHDIESTYRVLVRERARTSDAPTVRRATHSKGFRR